MGRAGQPPEMHTVAHPTWLTDICPFTMNNDIPGKPIEDLPGPILLDGLLQSFLLGTIVNQAFKYMLDYRDDSWRKRAFVLGVISLSM